jgi:hypothetical protein
MKYLVTILAMSFMSFSSAFAQSDGSTVMGDLAVMNTQTIITGEINNIGMQQTILGTSARKQGQNTQDTTLPSLSFQPSLKRRKANYAQFAKRAGGGDPEAAAAIEQLFASFDIVASMQAPMAKVGLSTNNLADAYTAWCMEAWSVIHDDEREATRALALAVKAQSTLAISLAPEFAQATDATKQEVAEAFLVHTALIGVARLQSKSDPASMKMLKNAVRQGTRAAGLDLDSVILTDDGFVPAKKPR